MNVKARVDRIAASVEERRGAQQWPEFLAGIDRFKKRAREVLEEAIAEAEADPYHLDYPPMLNRGGGSVRQRPEEGAAAEQAVRAAHVDWTEADINAEVVAALQVGGGRGDV